MMKSSERTVNDPKKLWRQSDKLRKRAKQMRDEAAALDRAAERLHRMAAAIQDGREDDLVSIALTVGRETSD